MIRVLHIVTSLAATGVPTLLYSYYSKMDRQKIHFDFVAIPSKVEHTYKTKFENLGCNVYYMPKKYLGRIPFLYKVIKDGHYDAVHSHIELASAVYLTIAKFAGVKVRVAHAHMAFLPYPKFHHKCLRLVLNHIATQKIGCSKDALTCLFGSDSGIVLHNAIDLNKFSFNPDIRNQYRKGLNLEGKTVVGFIGRFTKQKNVFYILDIFNELLKIRDNAILLIAGDGELKEEFFDKANLLGINDSICYLGPRNDIPALMTAMDCLLMPSLWEGLGIVLVEAQATSLMCFTSRYTVPYSDTNISGYIHYLDIKELPEIWAKAINELVNSYERKPIFELLRKHHYDIDVERNTLYNIYYEALSNK